MATKGKSEQPGHHTASGTKKHQANGPIAWSKVFRKVAGSDGREGEGVRAALAFAVEHEDKFIAWAEAHPTLWAPATTAPPPPKAKAPKAPKAKAPKAPKAPRAPKAPKAKAGEQTELPVEAQ